MRGIGSWTGIALAIAILGAGSAKAASDRIMDVVTMRFAMPEPTPDTAAKLEDCRAKLATVETEADASAVLHACHIRFDRDAYSILKSKTPDEEWQRDLAGAPIGKIARRIDGSATTFFIVRQERVLGMASLAEAFPIRRVTYEGKLSPPTQEDIEKLHDIDDVIAQLVAHNVHFAQDSGTLLSSSVPETISKALAELPAGEPIIYQERDHGTIYARRRAPRQ